MRQTTTNLSIQRQRLMVLFLGLLISGSMAADYTDLANHVLTAHNKARTNTTWLKNRINLEIPKFLSTNDKYCLSAGWTASQGDAACSFRMSTNDGK